MKYNIKKLESSKELEEIELVFYEDKNTDNCYYSEAFCKKYWKVPW